MLYKLRFAFFSLFAFVFAGSANAALPTEVTDAFTALQTDGADMISLGWPVVTAVVVGLILIKLFKKVATRAT